MIITHLHWPAAQKELNESQTHLFDCLHTAHQLLNEEASFEEIDLVLSTSLSPQQLTYFYETVLHMSIVAIPDLTIQDGKSLFHDPSLLPLIKQKAIIQFAFDCKLTNQGMPDFRQNVETAIQHLYEKAIRKGTAEFLAKILPRPGSHREKEQEEDTAPIRRRYSQKGGLDSKVSTS